MTSLLNIQLNIFLKIYLKASPSSFLYGDTKSLYKQEQMLTLLNILPAKGIAMYHTITTLLLCKIFLLNLCFELIGTTVKALKCFYEHFFLNR